MTNEKQYKTAILFLKAFEQCIDYLVHCYIKHPLDSKECINCGFRGLCDEVDNLK